MRVSLEEATLDDAPAIAAVRLAASRRLTERFGRGVWSYAAESEWSVRADIMTSKILIAREEGSVLATLRIATKPPWMGEIGFFTPCRTPLYLTTMAVAPKYQLQGIGSACLAEVDRLATEWPADAIRLDAYDLPAGAPGFYLKNGYTEVRRAAYHGTPLVYFEKLISSTAKIASKLAAAERS